MEGDVLDLLERLQRVADDIDRFQNRRRGAVEEQERAEAALQVARVALGEKEARAHGLDIERRKIELALKAERDRMGRTKARMGEVKTSREYQAVLLETTAVKQNIGELEETQLRDMQELEETAAAVEALRGQIGELEAIAEEGKKRSAVVIAEADTGIGARKADEAALLKNKNLPLEVVDRYTLIRKRRGGLAVVEARDEACTACYMRLPPQSYIEIVRRKVVQCPNCHRILVPPRPGVEQEAEV